MPTTPIDETTELAYRNVEAGINRQITALQDLLTSISPLDAEWGQVASLGVALEEITATIARLSVDLADDPTGYSDAEPTAADFDAEVASIRAEYDADAR